MFVWVFDDDVGEVVGLIIIVFCWMSFYRSFFNFLIEDVRFVDVMGSE